MAEENKYILKSPLRYLTWFSDKLNQVSIFLVVVLLLLMTLIVLSQVFSRYVLKNSITWSEEISRWLMIWICFLGSAIAVKFGLHIGLNFIFDRLPKKMQNLTSLLINICIFIFLYFCVMKSFNLAQFVIHQKTAAAQISMAWPYSAVPVGSVIMAVHVLLAILENCKKTFIK